MAQITLTIPDAQVQRVITALCAKPRIIPPPNSVPVEPTAANAKQMVVDWVKECIRAYEVQLAIDAIVPPDTSGLVT